MDASSALAASVGGLAHGKHTGPHLQKALNIFAAPEPVGRLMQAFNTSANHVAEFGLAHGKHTGPHLQKALNIFAAPEPEGRLMQTFNTSANHVADQSIAKKVLHLDRDLRL